MGNPMGKFSWPNVSNTRIEGVLAARFYKTNARLLPELQGISVVMWADSVHLAEHAIEDPISQKAQPEFPQDFADMLEQTLDGYDMALQKHADRDCVSDEAVPAGKRAILTLNWTSAVAEANETVASLKLRGFKDDVGLVQSDMFIYNTSSIQVRHAFLNWWYEIQLHSFRDQLSLPYELYRAEVRQREVCTGHCLISAIIEMFGN